MINDDKGTTIYTDEMYYKHTSDEENKYSYQYFGKKLGLNNLELFLITVLIGKYIVKNRENINDPVTLIKYESALKMGEPIKILQILAIEETDDINILNDKPRMFDIWEGYAMAGMKEFCKWYHSNAIDFEAKLEEEMSKVLIH
ncbi:hypothetical protein [Methanobrevibacter sp.]|uniref:hypothetical protein n=1 Tax=Methanobrevibacter sp. TaxID=66852 RepID=UPI00388DD222